MVHAILDSTIVRLVNYIDSKRAKPKRLTLVDLVERQAVIDSAEYAEVHMAAALYFRSRQELWAHALANAVPNGLYLEFGVYRGASVNWFADALPDKIIVGFDSFEGLHEDWGGTNFRKGHFNVSGRLPPVRNNVRLIKGWFDQTLPEYLANNQGNASLIHIDGDTYEATKNVLDLLRPRICKGAVIIFDQYFGYRGWRLGEWKAWKEFSALHRISYRYLSFSNQQAGLIVEAMSEEG
jgi:predicted O-methyltransferase YrrM